MTEIVVSPPPAITITATPGDTVTLDVTPIPSVTIEATTPAPVEVTVAQPAPIEVDVAAMGVPGQAGPQGPSGVYVQETEPAVTAPAMWVEVDGAGDPQYLRVVTP